MFGKVGKIENIWAILMELGNQCYSQDPEMEAMQHILSHRNWGQYPLKIRPYIYGRYLQKTGNHRYLKCPLKW